MFRKLIEIIKIFLNFKILYENNFFFLNFQSFSHSPNSYLHKAKNTWWRRRRGSSAGSAIQGASCSFNLTSPNNTSGVILFNVRLQFSQCLDPRACPINVCWILFLPFLQDAVCVELAGIIHFFHMGTRSGRLKLRLNSLLE